MLLHRDLDRNGDHLRFDVCERNGVMELPGNLRL
jgi:hypothetical protein